MLAPLENRAQLEREPDATVRADQLEKDNASLRRALQQTRHSQKRMLAMHARDRLALNSRIAALEQRCAAQAARIGALESGQAIIELGRQLMQLKDANERLSAAAARHRQPD